MSLNKLSTEIESEILNDQSLNIENSLIAFNKKMLLTELLIKSNYIIRDQADEHLYNLYYRNGNKLMYDLLTNWIYDKNNFTTENTYKIYLRKICILLDTTFPKYSDDYSPYSPKSFHQYKFIQQNIF